MSAGLPLDGIRILDFTAAMAGPSLQSDIVLPYLIELSSHDQRARWLPGPAVPRAIIPRAA